ncbi:hypothetical protein SNOG_16416 [Parastagonospora nodorum SN15]|uniref:Uncharacterized protein n=1 Tax=Phaeosphaeria nodorum (strain SN15 / ATCC MYA-4574 / FGSC 10173) TaxID=321614 RepID=Q0TVU1_PHANO|nr:hypothetical protein SNOG_16416 [Parastagonospora nodorum SN15]EAT76241.1 hypothetical protein SNOG_16416 [Parastagonospora nodorum SN15]
MLDSQENLKAEDVDVFGNRRLPVPEREHLNDPAAQPQPRLYQDANATTPTPCAHPDVRLNDDLGCCLSCGEIVDPVQASTQDSGHTTTPSVSVESPPSSAYYMHQDLELSVGREIHLMQLLPGK